MPTFATIILVISVTLLTPLYADQETAADIANIQSYFMEKFPEVPFQDFGNGVYALDPVARENWLALEEFPPYEVNIDNGQALWEENSHIYQPCFPNGPGVKHQYPQWSSELETVVTLAMEINLCRQKHNIPSYDYMQAEINDLLAFMAYRSRGEIIDIQIPNEKAKQAYLGGKKFYFTRRGQLNFACHHCHFDNAGKKLRSESLGPALGQTTGWPTYRNKWGALGPLHRRYIGCNKQVRAAPFEAQSVEYRNLEYFHTHMNNGLAINGPSVRR